MEAALKVVKCGSSVNRAAIDHGILPITLKDRLRGRMENSGMPRYLNTEEENKLVNFLMQCSSVGYGKTRQDVMKNLLRANQITQGWWRRFLERHNDLTLRQEDNTPHVRIDAVNTSTMKHYFDLLKKTLKENKLIGSPGQIYNVDECGIPLDPKAPMLLPRWDPKRFIIILLAGRDR